MKLCTILIGIAVLLLNISLIQADLPDKELHNRCLYPTIKVTLVGQDSGGTGTIVRSTKIDNNEYENVFITAGHVANRSGSFVIHTYEYKNYSIIESKTIIPCYFYAIDPERDMAIGIFITKKAMPTAEINVNPQLYIGNSVLRIGCGLGDDPRLDEGKISQVSTRISHHANMIRTTVHTLPGDSGSALFNENKIVGIMIMIRNLGPQRQFALVPGMSYAVPIQRFLTWSQENSNALSFPWDNKEALPKMPIYQIRLMEENEIIPD